MQDRRKYAVSFEKIRSVFGVQAATLLEERVAEMIARFNSGEYQNYREETYSNVAVTGRALQPFQDPAEAVHLYAPLKVS